MNISEYSDWAKQANRRPLIMGVINLTPDSFSDAGVVRDPRQAAQTASAMVRAGADWIDVGGESTRPGAQRVLESEQIRRTGAAIQAIRRAVPAIISIDTTRAAVAEAALDAGANIINDVSAGMDDPEMYPLAARVGAPIILMHMLGNPMTMQIEPAYDDVTREVSAFLIERMAAAEKAGIRRQNILFDPGIGFGKNVSHNLQLLHDTSALAGLGCPLVVGPSRKSFIGKIIGQANPAERVFGTAAAIAWCAANGAAVMRVHDVMEMSQVLRMIRAINAPNDVHFPDK